MTRNAGSHSGESRRGGARERVLGALRAAAPPLVALPDLSGWQSRPSDADARQEAFARSLDEAGAELVRVAEEGELAAVLGSYPPYAGAHRVESAIAGHTANARGAGAQEPAHHPLEDVDVTIARGAFGVAECGAIWCDGAGLADRAAYFLCEHLVLVLPAGALVDTLHDAYALLGHASGASSPRAPGHRAQAWSGFIAGPSKTADIEQALVVGAHGPRSLLVVLVGEAAEHAEWR